MPDPIPGGGPQPTPTPAPENPWAAFGLNPDGTPLVKPEDKPAEPQPTDARVQALESKLAAAEGALAKMPALEKQAAIVDRLIKAVSGDQQLEPQTKAYNDVMTDLKNVFKFTAPGVHKAILALEANPDLLDHLGQSVDTVIKGRVDGINTQAHDRLMEQSKAVFPKNLTEQERAEMLFPYETAITQAINASPELQRQFLSGRVDVVDEVFKRLAKPYVSSTLRAKAAATKPSSFPKAPPRGGAEPGATTNTDSTPNLRTPQGRAAFHKAAVNRFFERAGGNEE